MTSRKSCYQCTGDDCQIPQNTTCPVIMDNDQCFIQWDKNGAIVEMGCKSKYGPANVDFLVREKYLWLCDDDNCNDFDNIPETQTCIICNSRTDAQCAINPNNVTSSTKCAKLPYTQCYSRILEDGHTERGCLSNLESDEFYDCLYNINSTKCSSCVGDKCNQPVYPEGRRSCIRCNSSTFPACENNPNDFASFCYIYKENDKCVTKLESNHTIRDCASEISCDINSHDSCRICNNTDNCNTINLLPNYVGPPGKWQDLPLSCYSCEGKECNSGYGVASMCLGNNLQTCMTVFNSSGSVIKRGCSDAVISTHSEYCDENADKCFACKSNACNTARSLTDYIDCYSCDSSDSNSCSVNFDGSKTRTRKCHRSCVVALYPRISSNDTSYELSRSCLDDMDEDDRESCIRGKKEYCKACSGSRCNTMDVPDERLECYKCLNEDCEDMESQQCSLYHAQDQCYVLYNNESTIITMGCRSELKMSVVTELIKHKQMLLCDGKNCNAPENLPTSKLCSVCNSAENAMCATNPSLVNNIQRCPSLPYSGCFTRVNANAHTERGCLASLEDDVFYGCLMNTDGLCKTCTENKCNEIDVYPANRTSCHQCNSTVDPTCASAPNNNKVCKLYKDDDYCLTNYHNGITSRGCSSNMKCDNEKNPRTCHICFENGCNTINLEKAIEDGVPGRWQNIPLSCHTCKGEEECNGKGFLHKCQNNTLQSCMTVFDFYGKVTQRGCSDPVEADNKSYCEIYSDKCLRCNSNECNVATSLDEYVECLSCDGDINGDCLSNVTAITKTRQCYKYCMTALYPLFKEENPSYGLARTCYDDMDAADRELCTADKKEHCKVCSETKCNTINMPLRRHSCYICQGDDCQDPKPRECPTYRPNDKCYIRFDGQNAIVSFGCKSEFSNAEASHLLKHKRLHVCEGHNCNSFDNITSSNTCVLCNSRTDIQCAINPLKVATKTNCNKLAFTECYSRVLSDGATERGCLSNLYDDEFESCLNGISNTCKSCKGENCNNDIFPETRLKCHVCNSNITSSCEVNPNSLSVCPVYHSNDTCVTTIHNGVTSRGCSSSIRCDTTNPKTCVICSGEGCNTVNLAKQQDDNYGKWQDLPLTCLDCSGNNCTTAAGNTSTKCQMNNLQDCITVFDDSDKVVRRGCADIVASEYGPYCARNESNCFTCKSNKCNTATSKSVYVDCIYCDSHKDQECVWNPQSTNHTTRKCKNGCMTALFPSDNSENPSYDLIRTCLDDKEVNDRKMCSKGKDKHCKSCNSNKCNTDIVPANRTTCLFCRGESCEKPESKLCPLYKKNDQCFIRFNNQNHILEMGCVSSFQNQDLENIIKTKKVYICSGNNCNTLDKIPSTQICATCDSLKDKNCAVSPNDIGTSKNCTIMPFTSCVTKLTINGATIRGCLTDLPDDDFVACVLGKDKNCSLCNKKNCNREIFPEDRQQCFTCTSEENPECESYPTTKMPCAYVNENESCMTALSNNVTVRGCKSSIYCDENDSKTCRSCFGTGCNSIDLYNKQDDGYHGAFQDLPLKCYTCNGTHCLHSLGPSKICSSRNIYQDCMTVFDELGRVQRRGCSDDVDDYSDLYCRQHPERCFKCKSNECNSVWNIREYIECIFCDSETEPNCILNPEYDAFRSRKCYKECMVAMKGQQIIRSCLDDKEMWVQSQCYINNSKDCAACSDDNCNKFTFPKDRTICHVCADSSCTTSISQNCAQYKAEDSCFAKYENGVIDLMGCVSSQNDSDIAEWTAQNKLYKCKGNNCNELSNLLKGGICYSCNSSIDLNCAQNPSLVSSMETCLIFNNKCYTKVDSQGHTLRGCLSNLNASEQSCETLGTCSVCFEEKCNNKIYPANRLECHICDSASDKNCATNPTSLQVCPIYDPNDSCVSTINKTGLLLRGCTSQIKCDDNDSNRCHICNTNGCNTVPIKGSANFTTSNPFLTLFLAVILVLVLKDCDL